MSFQVKGLDKLHRALGAYEKGESAASSRASFSAASVFAGAAEVAVAAATGGDAQLSGMKGRKAKTLKVIVRPERIAGKSGAGWVASANPKGQWAIVEGGADKHTIGVGRGRQRGRRALLSFGEGQAAYGPVEHPGSPGKRPFAKSTRAVEPRARKVWAATYLAQTTKLLGR